MDIKYILEKLVGIIKMMQIIFDGNYSRHIGLTVRMKVEPNLLRTNTAIFYCNVTQHNNF